MAKRKWEKFYLPDVDHSTREGICIEYNTRDREITISGWYDTMVGIEGKTMPLGEFLSRLNITPEDIIHALIDHEIRHHGA